ncbi:hypothetical protein EBB07_29540 [Paenibacillaceae bacterium]|nr:hypothetical protein EBB07_29540 [Paenibacillaceae bacterium]
MKPLNILFTNTCPLIKYGMKSGFDNLGHRTYIMDDHYRLWDKDKEIQNELFKQAIEEYSIDIVFTEPYANMSEGIFKCTREKGIFHVFWSIEDTPHDHWIGDYWSDFADYIFTTTAECLPNYWSKGKKADLLLFACNPDYHMKTASIDSYRFDLIVVGNNYERRESKVKSFLQPLINNNINMKVYGNEWWIDETRSFNLLKRPHIYGGYLAYEDMPAAYSSSKIAFGLNLDGDSYTQTSMRMYEILGCGGALMLSYHTKAQELLFHDLVYLPKTPDEALLMTKEILSMTVKQRAAKANKAQKFVYKYHNYTNRASQVIDAYNGR